MVHLPAWMAHFSAYIALYRHMKGELEYAALPRKAAQWAIKQVCACAH